MTRYSRTFVSSQHIRIEALGHRDCRELAGQVTNVRSGPEFYSMFLLAVVVSIALLYKLWMVYVFVTADLRLCVCNWLQTIGQFSHSIRMLLWSTQNTAV